MYVCVIFFTGRYRSKMADAWIRTVLLANQKKIGALYTAAKTAQQQVYSGYNTSYVYSPIEAIPPIVKTYSGKQLIVLQAIASQNTSAANLSAMVLSGNVTYYDSATRTTNTIAVDDTDQEVIILLANQGPVGAMLMAPPRAVQAWGANGTYYSHTATGLINFMGIALGPYTYSSGALRELAATYYN